MPMMMNRQRAILTSGIILGIAAVFAVKMYLDQERANITQKAKKAVANIQANQSSVLVASRDIPRGAPIEKGMFEASIVPNKYVQPRAATSADSIANMVAQSDIPRGSQITLDKLSAASRAAQGGDLSGLTPPGKRAVTITVDNMASLAGMIKPGDYVDVIAMLPVPVQTPQGQQSQLAALPLFQNVLVLAVGRDTGELMAAQSASRYAAKKEEADTPSPLITLALNPPEASLIAFVQEQGKLRLVLRSPADAKIEPLPPASWETLFQYLAPQPSPEMQAAGEAPSADYVEIYRGLKKERVPLAK